MERNYKNEVKVLQERIEEFKTKNNTLEDEKDKLMTRFVERQ